MSPVTIVLLVILAVLIAATIALYFLGKKAQKRKDEQDAQQKFRSNVCLWCLKGVRVF